MQSEELSNGSLTSILESELKRLEELFNRPDDPAAQAEVERLLMELEPESEAAA